MVLLLPLLLTAAACGPSVDLAAALEVTDASGGFYDNGMKDGEHHVLPSVSFRLRNRTDLALDGIQVMVQFRRVGLEEDFDSRLVSGVRLAPGGRTDLTLVRAERGYTLANPNIDELFDHSNFTDFTVRFFARRSGAIVQIGEHQLERRILTQPRDSDRP